MCLEFFLNIINIIRTTTDLVNASQLHYLNIILLMCLCTLIEAHLDLEEYNLQGGGDHVSLFMLFQCYNVAYLEEESETPQDIDKKR